MGNSDAPAVVLCSGLDREQATRVVTLLMSMGIEPAVVTSEPVERARSHEIRVSVGEAQAARALLREEFPYGFSPGIEQIPPNPSADARVPAPTGWFGRGAGAILVVVAVCAAIFAFTSLGPEAGSRLRFLEAGAISHTHLERGEYWRLLTAVFVHFNFIHLATNMATLLILGPPLAHLVGPRRFALIFVLSGIGGNVLSHEMTPTLGLKAGASGAIAGVLGALGGQALRPRESRYKSWQVLGALAAVYGLLIGFGEGNDNTAHLGGLIAGVVLGRLSPPLPEDPGPDALRATPHPPP